MIKMLRDFRGRASGERYFKEGELVNITEEFEEAMVMEGVAQKIVDEIKLGDPEEVDTIIIPDVLKKKKR